MPQLATRALGTVEINPAENIQFPDGLFGFSDVREFALLGERPDSPFKWLQSTARPDLAFIVIEPHLFLKEAYRPVLMRSDLEQLKVEKVEDCTIYLIVTIPRDHPEKMTANLPHTGQYRRTHRPPGDFGRRCARGSSIHHGSTGRLTCSFWREG